MAQFRVVRFRGDWDAEEYAEGHAKISVGYATRCRKHATVCDWDAEGYAAVKYGDAKGGTGATVELIDTSAAAGEYGRRVKAPS